MYEAKNVPVGQNDKFLVEMDWWIRQSALGFVNVKIAHV
jgi:hypothetical protein